MSGDGGRAMEGMGDGDAEPLVMGGPEVQLSVILSSRTIGSRFREGLSLVDPSQTRAPFMRPGLVRKQETGSILSGLVFQGLSRRQA